MHVYVCECVRVLMYVFVYPHRKVCSLVSAAVWWKWRKSHWWKMQKKHEYKKNHKITKHTVALTTTTRAALKQQQQQEHTNYTKRANANVAVASLSPAQTTTSSFFPLFPLFFLFLYIYETSLLLQKQKQQWRRQQAAHARHALLLFWQLAALLALAAKSLVC